MQAVNERVVTVTTAYSEIPVPEAAWSIDATTWRCSFTAWWASPITVTTPIPSTRRNTIRTSTPASIPARIDDRPISIIPPGVQAPPKNITIDSYPVSQGIAITTLRAAWGAVENAIAYEAEWRKK